MYHCLLVNCSHEPIVVFELGFIVRNTKSDKMAHAFFISPYYQKKKYEERRKLARSHNHPQNLFENGEICARGEGR